MKIIIPTYGHFSIAKSLEKAISIRFISIDNNRICDDMLIKIDNKLSAINELEVNSISFSETLGIDPFTEQSDQIVVIQGEDQSRNEFSDEVKYKILDTHDSSFIDTINSIVKNYQTAESDFCCCP